MSWSCTKAAGDRMDALTNWCIEHCGDKAQNVFLGTDDQKHFWEASNVEHDNGQIDGHVYRLNPDGTCNLSGRFQIAPDGRITRFDWLPSQAYVDTLKPKERDGDG